ncbi:MAG TPA: PQQ-dependent sugar dehydrogenase, partial [Ardenticatenaceae bacterium]|nr:PQQ-dependent sugar dehydrogenase [Ardenticatenaceae bacterium]
MPLFHRLRGAILAGLLLILALVGGVHLVQANEPVSPRLFVQYGPDAEPVPMLPADFADVKVAAVNGPTDLEFLPDGRLLITRHYGVVSLWSGGTTTTEVLDIRDITCYAPERGLGGIAVDPNFSSNHYVYLYYSRKMDPSCPVSDDDIIPGLPVNRVSRFTMNPTTSMLDRNSETVIVDNIEAVWALHNGGGLEFGADGYLYVSVGDTGMIYNPDNPDSLRGKILRVDKSSGDGVPGNKYFNDPAAVRCGDGSNKQHEQGKPCREIFAIGLRNPFRIAFRPGTNEFFINDVGKQKYEEINLGAAGADYGWSRREGPCPYDTDCTPSGLVPPNDPIFWYHHDEDPNPIFHGCFAITGADFVPAGAWPAGYQGDYIFGDFTCGKIWRLEPKSGGGYQASLLAEGIGSSSIVAMAFGPSPVGQSLYYVVQNGNGQLHRIDYTGGGNRAPTAALSATPTYGPTPLTVSFDASGSSDPDPGDTLTYIWNFGDGTGTSETSSPTTSHTYSTAGAYNATVQVRDNHGAVSALPASVRIDVGNSPPQPQIVAPAANAVYRVGQVFTLRGQASDPEDGQLPDAALSWRMLLHHNDHVHPFLGPESGNAITFTAPTPEDLYAAATSYLEIELTATDSQGLSRVVTQNLQPHKIAVSFATEPPGLNLIVNGSIITTPQTLTSWEGYQLNLTAPNQQDASGRQMRFQSWSDGGAQSHSVTTPATPVTYRAIFVADNTAVLTPSADAYVREAAPGTNYGTLSTLRVDGGTDPDEAIYLRYNVPGATRPILAAKLRLYAQTDS